MTDDPIVTAVRDVRDNLSRRLNYDLHAILEDMRNREKAHGSRLLSPSEPVNALSVEINEPNTTTPDHGE